MKQKKIQKIFGKNRLKDSTFNTFKNRSSCIFVTEFEKEIDSSEIYSNYFFNMSFDKSRLKNFVWWFLKKYGQKKTTLLLEELKTIGFGYATLGGISLGIDDLKIPPNKSELLFKADGEIGQSRFRYKRGEITGVERFQQLIDTWHQTSETLKQDVIKYFELTDVLNPVYMMAFSGARGNISQVRQLVGMRGLMADPQGQIIDFPIRSNFREGLTLTEYIISTYGARKGIVDTALRTATAGYLTRRLVDVAQHVVVSQFDCGTMRGIFLFAMKEGLKTLYSFKDRLIGRVLAQDLFMESNDKRKTTQFLEKQRIGIRNQEISADLAQTISKITKKALVRSPLTCETRRLVCQLCYGWSLSKGSLVSLGEVVGVIAAQSIGEPGTQLTMRTFHTGGVFSAGITDQIIAPTNGSVHYSHPIPGSCIRTPQGEIAFLTKVAGSVVFKRENPDPSLFGSKTVEQMFKIPAYTILFVRHEQKVRKKQILAQFSSISKQQAIQADAEQVIYSSLEGQIYYCHLDLREESHDKYGDITWKTDDWAKVWILSGKVYENPVKSHFFPKQGDFITPQSLMNQIQWYSPSASLISINFKTTQPELNPQNSFQKFRAYQHQKQTSCFLPNKTLMENLTLQFINQNRHGIKQSWNFDKIHKKSKIRISKKQSSSPFIKKSIVNPSALSLNSTLNIFSTRLFQTKANKPFFQNSSQRLKNEVKIAPLMLPFYYPFQRLSYKRLIRSLNSGTFSKSIRRENLKIRTFYPKLKKIQLSIVQLQKKWQLWFKSYAISKTSRTQRIQTQIQDQFEFNKSKLYRPEKSRANFLLTDFSGVRNSGKKWNFTLLPSIKSILFKKLSKNHVKSLKIRQKTALLLMLKKSNFKDNMDGRPNQKSIGNKFQSLCTRDRISNIQNELQRNINRHNIPLNHSCKKSIQLTELYPDLVLKNPILTFNLQTLNFKKFSYVMTQNQNSTFLAKKRNFNQSKQPTEVHLNLDFVNKNNQMKILTFIPLNPNFFESNFGRKHRNFQTPFDSNELVKTRLIKNTNLELQNTFSWSNFPTTFFSWFPTEYQTHNNGIFFLSGVSYRSKKNTKTCHPEMLSTLFQLQKKLGNKSDVPKMGIVSNISLLNLSNLKFRNPRKMKTFSNCKLLQSENIKCENDLKNPLFSTRKVDFQSLLVSSEMILKSPKNVTFEKNLKMCQRIPNYSKNKILRNNTFKNLEKNDMINFFKVKSGYYSLRWNHKQLNKKLAIKEFDILSCKEIKKSSVTFDELFWLPQQNYEVGIPRFSPSLNKEMEFQNMNCQFIATKAPIFSLLNNQGLKKSVFSTLEGIFSINVKKTKVSKPFETSNSSKFILKTFSNSKNQNQKSNGDNCQQMIPQNVKKESSLEIQNTGVQSIHQLQFSLKDKLLLSIYKHGENKVTYHRIKEIFLKKSLESKTIPNKIRNSLISLGTRSELLNFKSYASRMIQLKTKIDSNLEQPQKSLDKMKTVFTKKLPSEFTLICIEITVKEGWLYKLNDASKIHFLHQSIIEPGNTFLKDLSFYQHRIFIEIIAIHDLQQVKLLDQQSLHPNFFIKRQIINKKSRFFKDSSLPTHSSSFLILLRPMHFKLVQNLQVYKTKLYKTTKKNSFSLLTLKKFHSNLLNQQLFINKLINLSPAPDITLSSKLNIQENSREEKITHLKSGKIMPNLLPIQSKFRQSLNLKNEKTIPESPLILRKKFNSSFVENKYFSFYPLNFLKLNIHGSIPPMEFYLFKVPLIQFNTSLKSMGSFSNTELLNKFQILDFFKLKTDFLSSKTDLEFKEQTNPFPKNEFVRAMSLVKMNSVLQDFLIPGFEFSYSEKMNFLYNQRFFDYQSVSTANSNRITKFVNTKLTPLNIQNTHALPKLINKCLLYDENQTLHTQSIGKTSFLSPFKGEILTNKGHLKSPLQNSIDLELSSPQKQTLILTKGDLVTISLMNSEFIQDSSLQNLFSKFETISQSVEKNLHKKLNQVCLKTVFSSVNLSSSIQPTFKQIKLNSLYLKISHLSQHFLVLENQFNEQIERQKFDLQSFKIKYQGKIYKINGLKIGPGSVHKKLRLGKFLVIGDPVYSNLAIPHSGQIIHFNALELTLRNGECISGSPSGILHSYNKDFIQKNTPIMTLPFQTLKTGDIVQGIPKVEQYLEARTTQQGRLFIRSLPVLIQAIFERYCTILSHEKAVRQSFLKIQQILVDGVQRVYRSQGISIADKHLEIIVKQMTSKVQIIFGGQTGLFPGEFVDLDFVERINKRVLIKIYYEPIVLGITRASLEVESFLSAASFQQTTKILARAAIYKQKDYLKGLKENLLIGNLIPAGTGYIITNRAN